MAACAGDRDFEGASTKCQRLISLMPPEWKQTRAGWALTAGTHGRRCRRLRLDAPSPAAGGPALPQAWARDLPTTATTPPSQNPAATGCRVRRKLKKEERRKKKEERRKKEEGRRKKKKKKKKQGRAGTCCYKRGPIDAAAPTLQYCFRKLRKSSTRIPPWSETSNCLNAWQPKLVSDVSMSRSLEQPWGPDGERPPLTW